MTAVRFSLVACFLTCASLAQAASVSVQVSANNDDAEERVSDGDMSRNSSDLELVHDGGTNQIVGVRFRNVAIPPGVNVTSAYIQFNVDETDSGTTNVIIEGQNIGDAPGFGNGDNNISNRTPTAANVPWSIPPWLNVGDAGADQRTPDLRLIVTEILANPGWSSGNDMVFMVRAGAGCNSSACQRTAESRNGSRARAPILTINWVTPGTVDLAVTQSDSPDPVTVGNSFSYTLNIANNGTEDATNVSVVDTLPTEVSLQSITTSQGSCSGTNPVTCSLGDMPGGANAQIVLIVQADSGGIVTNTATVSSSEPDDDNSNNSNTETTTITSNSQQLCYLVADSGGGNGGNDLLTQLDTADFNPATNEQSIGTGTGTSTIEAIAWNSSTQVLYAADSNRLGTLSVSSGAFSPLPNTFGTGSDGSGNNITFSDVDGLSYDATTGILYGVHANSGDDVLFQINMTTGAHIPNAFGPGVDYVTTPAILGNSITDDIAVDPTTGIMYASVNSGGSSDRLITINKQTGATADIAQITVPDIEGLGTDSSGQLWGTSGTQGIVYEISKFTGVGSFGRPVDNGSDYESIDCFAVSPSVTAELAVNKSVDNANPGELEGIAYTVTVTNNGSGTATSVQINDNLPAGVTFQSAAASQGLFDATSGNWYVGSLANAASASLTINVTVDSGTFGSTITNTASISYATQSDPNSSNNQGSVDINVAGVALSKQVVVINDTVTGASNPKAIPGATVQYRIVASNESSVGLDTDSIEIVDRLPGEVEFVVGSGAPPITFIDGSPGSGLTYTFSNYASTTDDIDFSADTNFADGITWGYIPNTTANTDPAITAIRILPKGVLNGSSGAGDPNFVIEYNVVVK